MLRMSYKNTRGEKHTISYESHSRPQSDILQLEEVLQIDVDGDDIHIARNMNLPIAYGRPYTRYQGDLAKFIWDNL